MPCMKNYFKTKDFCFINHSIGPPSEKFIGQPSDQVHGTTLRYQNLLDNPPISIYYWTTLQYDPFTTHVNILSMHISTSFSHNLHVIKSINQYANWIFSLQLRKNSMHLKTTFTISMSIYSSEYSEFHN